MSDFVTALSREAVGSGLLISTVPSGTEETPGTKNKAAGHA